MRDTDDPTPEEEPMATGIQVVFDCADPLKQARFWDQWHQLGAPAGYLPADAIGPAGEIGN